MEGKEERKEENRKTRQGKWLYLMGSSSVFEEEPAQFDPVPFAQCQMTSIY